MRGSRTAGTAVIGKCHWRRRPRWGDLPGPILYGRGGAIAVGAGPAGGSGRRQGGDARQARVDHGGRSRGSLDPLQIQRHSRRRTLAASLGPVLSLGLLGLLLLTLARSGFLG